MRFAKLIAGSTRRALPEWTAADRRWCSDRRVLDRRLRDLPVERERRRLSDRRSGSARRSGLDRRGNRVLKTLWFHRCSKPVGDDRRCEQPAILRSSLGWRCFWHLDRHLERRNG